MVSACLFYNALNSLFAFSRAHTIVGITFVQKQKNDAGKETAKTAIINLVDLAGRWVRFSV